MQSDQSESQALLQALNAKIRDAIRSGSHSAEYPREILFVLLAEFFSYNIIQGGFAQLVYNAKGAYLAEMEDMLVAADATVAHEYYVRAIKKCLEDTDIYQQFIEGAYTDNNLLKNQLHTISLDYNKAGKDFFAESGPFIHRSEAAVHHWLNNGAIKK